jgi:aconitate hydratase
MTGRSLGVPDQLVVGDASYGIFRLDRVKGSARLPYTLKVLLENLLRNQDGTLVTDEQVSALAAWDPTAEHGLEMRLTRARVLLHDSTGGPCVVDLVTMPDEMPTLGDDPQKIIP